MVPSKSPPPLPMGVVAVIAFLVSGSWFSEVALPILLSLHGFLCITELFHSNVNMPTFLVTKGCPRAWRQGPRVEILTLVVKPMLVLHLSTQNQKCVPAQYLFYAIGAKAYLAAQGEKRVSRMFFHLV